MTGRPSATPIPRFEEARGERIDNVFLREHIQRQRYARVACTDEFCRWTGYRGLTDGVSAVEMGHPLNSGKLWTEPNLHRTYFENCPVCRRVLFRDGKPEPGVKIAHAAV